MRGACAAGGGCSKPLSSAAVENCEEERKPEAVFGYRKVDQIPHLRRPPPECISQVWGVRSRSVFGAAGISSCNSAQADLE